MRPNDPRATLDAAAADAGWTPATGLAVVLDFLAAQPPEIRAAFARHVADRAAEDYAAGRIDDLFDQARPP